MAKSLRPFFRLSTFPATMTVRTPSHAGSWYSASKTVLSRELDEWLDAVPAQTKCIGAVSSKGNPVDLPSPGARAIIAP